MARSVRDAALLLGAMTGADPEDPATRDAPAERIDYTANLTADALDGKRIGVVRSYFGAGSNPDVADVLSRSIDTLRAGGAIIVDDIDLDTAGASDAEWLVLLYEFKADLAVYFERSKAPVRSLADVIAFNDAHADAVMPHFGQEIMLLAEEKGGLDSEEYLAALADSKRITREALAGALAEHDLDALVAITNGPAWKTDHVTGDHFSISSSSFAAISGHPNVTVPAGFVAGLPVGLSFIGPMWSEPELLPLAYAFEQASEARRPPAVGVGTAK